MTKEQKVEAGSPHVYQAIAEIQGALAEKGIEKARQAQGAGANYKFRGIDDVYAALSPLLAAHKLVIIPRISSREVAERKSSKGNALFYVTVHAEFDFVSALDGTTHTCATYGEAMDSGDKATNKAMSAAYKYAAFLTFGIPVEGNNDTEAHEVEAAARVSEEQVSLIQDLAPKAGKDVREICESYGIAGLPELSEKGAGRLIARLQELAKEPA